MLMNVWIAMMGVNKTVQILPEATTVNANLAIN